MHLQAALPDTVSGLLGLEDILGDVVDGPAGAFLVANIMLIMAAFAGPWVKWKITAAFTGRIAVNRIGPFGLLTIVTGAIRLLSKELVVPGGVDHPAWDLASMVIPFSTLPEFAVIPMGNGTQFADPETDLAFAFIVVSIASLGIAMTGYALNNKFSLIGALRAIVANIAYEVPSVVTAASVVIFAGSLRMSEIVTVQAEPLLSVAGVAIPMWFAFVNPFTSALFVIANLAEVGRDPFDIPETPTEIVAGCQTEYSSVYFVLICLGEFIYIFLGGAIAATLFLGGLAGPVLPGFIWFTAKIWAFFLFTQWARSAVPRFRVDQFLEIGWKGILVLSFVNLALTAIIAGVVA